MERYYLETPVGTLAISGNENGLASVLFLENNNPQINTSIPNILVNTITQLKEYFEGTRTIFNLKLNPEGTDFQKKVWSQLQEIEYGKTVSYQHIANQLGNPKVIRASASANGKNPISIIITCHRVLGSDGSLTGYAGGLHRKKWLLAHESSATQDTLF